MSRGDFDDVQDLIDQAEDADWAETHGVWVPWQSARYSITPPVPGEPGSFTGVELEPVEVHATAEEIRAHTEYMEMVRDQYHEDAGAGLRRRLYRNYTKGWVA